MVIEITVFSPDVCLVYVYPLSQGQKSRFWIPFSLIQHNSLEDFTYLPKNWTCNHGFMGKLRHPRAYPKLGRDEDYSATKTGSMDKFSYT